ncbi:MAG: penicillin-insensitive murein endopeptidase [Myxococcales bacterium]|nr:penicillin-insensitive murein endopeptidase [Myxococcales bacterium]MCB9567642.1 penicillin-insensitive murein endopeptidase [Myxococcales bacterium]MCB9702542.1 penicillin-insensitive murein endopeptidase [Myxococcales bacterium]
MGTWRRVASCLALAATLGGLLSCAGANLWTDWTSVSTGHSNRGRLRRPVKMPSEGPGFRVPTRWRDRGVNYGVEELVLAVQRAAALVHGSTGDALLGVADISPLAGGRSRWHRSHQSGRDVDLLFYTVDDEGNPLGPSDDDMIHFDAEGKAYAPKRTVYDEEGWEGRRFDPVRNWLLLEALLGDPTIRVQWVFVSDDLREILLTHAIEAGRPAWAIEYARVVLRQPADAPPHDDHFHLRIYCSRSDRFHGCDDRGPVWHHEKKSFKYGGAERYDPVLWRMATATPYLVGLH